MVDRAHRPDPGILLAFIGRAPLDGFDRAAAYEDAVLPLLEEHGGEVVFRGRQAGNDPSLPAEIQVLRVPSQRALDAFLADDRRAQLQADHGEVFTDTTVVRLEAVVPAAPPPEADDSTSGG